MFIPEVTKFLRSQNLQVKAVLLLDNASSHPPPEELKSDYGSIFTLYMPLNVTTFIQPMDQNAIRLTKQFNRKHLLSQIIGTDKDIGETLKYLSLKVAIVNLALAWKNLKPEVMLLKNLKPEKCWHNLFSPLANEDDDEEEIPLSVLRSRIMNEEIDTVRSGIDDLLQAFNPQVNIYTMDVDGWNKDILPDKESEDHSESDENCQVQERGEVEVIRERVTTESAIKSLNNVIQWAEENEAEYSNLLVLQNLRNEMVQKGFMRQKQTN
ncbi:jerky protein homolog-like [Sitophilus oryzae]|uniref:Jerky protein homolog-like n=1 Tax=Sitophilus oryzae TaxID=7048 RepID=A0A6J2Y327_SITOR|nr:jerky protein homolog-like [Sitophilus oryzae]